MTSTDQLLAAIAAVREVMGYTPNIRDSEIAKTHGLLIAALLIAGGVCRVP